MKGTATTHVHADGLPEGALRGHRPQDVRCQSGYCLLDLLTTMAIFGILLGAALPHVDTRRDDVNATVKRVVADLRWARGRAIASGDHFGVRWTGGQTYQVERLQLVGETWQFKDIVKKVELPDHLLAYDLSPPFVEFNTRGMVVFPPGTTPYTRLARIHDDKFNAEHAVSIWPSGQIHEEW